jgi:hypothetical protein
MAAERIIRPCKAKLHKRIGKRDKSCRVAAGTAILLEVATFLPVRGESSGKPYRPLSAVL